MSRPRWAIWVTRISLVIGLVALAFTIYSTGLYTIGRYFKLIGWWWFAVAALEIAITALDAFAIRCFLSPEQRAIKLRTAVLSQLAGRAVNAVTPSGNLGEAIKVSVLVEHVSQSRAVATILLYNVVSFTVELVIVALAAPVMALLVPMPTAIAWLMFGTGVVCLVVSLGLYALVQRGMLVSVVNFACRMRLISSARHARWVAKVQPVDDKMRANAGGRHRDRWLGITAVTVSRLTSMFLSLMILHAIGEHITLGFIAAYTVGGFVIYMASSLVPMGVGVSEGGNYALFRALGENPARGVALVLARRTTLIMYAAIGLVLMTASETVKRARERQAEKSASDLPIHAADGSQS